MEAKHTPGPWVAELSANLPEESRRFASWPLIGTDGKPDFSNPVAAGINSYNARLIAAAPDLLEALRNLMDGLSSHICDEAGLWSEYEQSRAAIAKATGGVA